MDTKFLYSCLINFIKVFPVVIQVIIVANIFDYYHKFSITNWLYPLFGFSVLWGILMLLLSIVFKFCIWHRLLIYNIIFNSLCEFISVNSILDFDCDTYMGFVSVVSSMFLLLSIVTRFKFGCRK